MTVEIGSLCSGYGGLDLAAEQLTGGRTIWHAEIDPDAATVLEARWPNTPNLGDLTETDWTTVQAADVITAGYPCQPFSHAGRRKGEDDERHIWPAIRDTLGVLRPRLVLLENVTGHLALGAPAVIGDLAALGYVGAWRTVRASDIGACHRRDRLFIMAAHPDGVGWVEGAGSGEGESARLGRYGSDDNGRAAAPDAHEPGSQGPEPAGRPHVPTGSDRAPGPVALLPTPTAGNPNDEDLDAWEARRQRNAAKGYNGNGQGTPLSIAVRILPTPPATDAKNGRTDAWDDRFGDYGQAVARHATVFGSCPPAPLTTRQRLNPAFVEWMMMLPAGWVTAPELGLSRSAQLRILGNGVVPAQAHAAYRSLLEALP